MLDRLEEPVFTCPSDDMSLRWENFGEIPPVLVARLRVPGAPPRQLYVRAESQ